MKFAPKVKAKHTDRGRRARLVVWTNGMAVHKVMTLIARTGIPFESQKANTHFAVNAQGGMANQKAELATCAAILMVLDCELEVRLDNMWVKMGVEQMLSWIARKKQPTCRSEHTPMCGRREKYWDGNMATDGQSKGGAKATTTSDERVCAKEAHDPESADGCNPHT